MTSVKLFVLYIIATFTVFSCNSQKSGLAFIHFPVEKSLDEKQLCKLDAVKPDGLMLINDSLLLIRNYLGSTEHFNLFDVNQKVILSSLLPVGRKKDESLSFLSYGQCGNKLWVNDIVKEEVLLLNLDSIAINKNTVEYKMPVFYYSVQMLNDSMLIGTGDYDSEYKISILNLFSGKIIDQLIPYKSQNGGSVSREKKMAYESFLFAKPDGGKCVLACRYADQVEIVDIKNKTSKIIKGPEGYEPDVLVATGNDGKKLSTRNKKTRFAFVRGKVNNDYIFLLYSGNNNESEHLDYGRYLYVYDWKGNPIQKLKFSSDVVDFAVTADNKILYAYHPGKKLIMMSNLFTDETK